MRMKRILALVLTVVLCAGCLAGCGGSKTLKVGMTVYKPMNYKDDNGEWTGFDTEFAQKAAKSLGYDNVEFIPIEWDNKFFELNSGAIDCIWNGMTITDEVKTNADVTDAYVENAQVVVMNAAAKADYSREALANYKIAVESGSAAADVLEEMNVPFTAVTAQTDALLEVNSGSSQACVIDVTMATNMLTEAGGYSSLAIVDSLSEELYGIAFKKGSDLTAKMNKIIADYKQDGTLKALGEKYGLTIAK